MSPPPEEAAREALEDYLAKISREIPDEVPGILRDGGMLQLTP